MTGLPIACTLDATELRHRRDVLLPGLIARAESHERIDGGIRIRFCGSPQLMVDIARAIAAERECCRFLRFQVTLEPDLGPIWLEVTGPEGTTDFLAQLLR